MRALGAATLEEGATDDACDAAAIDKQADALRAALEAPRAGGSVSRRGELRKRRRLRVDQSPR